jgi:hypothetical protein
MELLMGNGDSKFRSRKFLLATAAFIWVSLMAGWGEWKMAEDAKDVALLIGAWGTPVAVILGLYQHFNVKADGK